MPQKGWFGLSPVADLPQFILASLEERSKVVQELRNDIKGFYCTWLEPGTLSRTLRRLEQWDWIELQESDKENCWRYRLTDAGRLVLEQRRMAFFEKRERLQSPPAGGLHKERIVMMIILWILHLYPRAWRERYEPEMVTLLEEYPITFLTGLDLLWGAFDAWIDPYYRRVGVPSPHQRMQRIRTAIVVAFGVFPLALSFSIFKNARLDAAWLTLTQMHPFLTTLLNMMSLLGNILWIAALIAALALVAYRGKMSVKREDHILALLPFMSAGIALIAFVAFVASVSLPMSWLNSVLILGQLGIPVMIALALAKGDIGKRLERLFLVLGALMIVGILLSRIVIGVAQIIAGVFWLGSTWSLTMIGGILSLPVIAVAIWLLVRGFATLQTPHALSGRDAERLPSHYIQHKQAH